MSDEIRASERASEEPRSGSLQRVGRRHSKPVCATCAAEVELQDSVWCPHCGDAWRGDHNPPHRIGAMPPTKEVSEPGGENQ